MSNKKEALTPATGSEEVKEFFTALDVADVFVQLGICPIKEEAILTIQRIKDGGGYNDHVEAGLARLNLELGNPYTEDAFQKRYGGSHKEEEFMQKALGGKNPDPEHTDFS